MRVRLRAAACNTVHIMKLNTNYLNVNDSYLFSTIAKKVAAYQQAHPDKTVLRLGIGDVTPTLAPAVISALHSVVDEMANKDTFRGYGPEQGYGFLKDSIAAYYKERGVQLAGDEIFISDGAKSDLGNILDLFSQDNVVLVPDPVYPVYVDTNVMAGRKIIYADANEANGFLPMPDYSVDADLIYICSPNNPTGAAYTVAQLKEWVDYATKKGAIILYDAAYECFVESEGLARSIYQVEGAKNCAIEFCSFSKMAGFTGTRCGYTVVPEAIEKDGLSVNKMWLRRQTTKFNGVPYIVQRGAAAVFTKEGREQISKNLDYYRANAKVIAEGLKELGIWFTGGENSPYIWLKCPGVLRLPSRKRAGGWHSRRGLRRKRRRLLPSHRVRQRGSHQRGGRAHQKTAFKVTLAQGLKVKYRRGGGKGGTVCGAA